MVGGLATFLGGILSTTGAIAATTAEDVGLLRLGEWSRAEERSLGLGRSRSLSRSRSLALSRRMSGRGPLSDLGLRNALWLCLARGRWGESDPFDGFCPSEVGECGACGDPLTTCRPWYDGRWLGCRHRCRLHSVLSLRGTLLLLSPSDCGAVDRVHPLHQVGPC